MKAVKIAQDLLRVVLRHWSPTKKMDVVSAKTDEMSSRKFWKTEIKILLAGRYGRCCLSEEEWKDSYNISQALHPFGFARFRTRVLALSGIDMKGLGQCIKSHAHTPAPATNNIPLPYSQT